MSLSNCPHCNKKISTKAKSCSHCGYPLSPNDEAAQMQFARKQRERRRSIEKQSFLALALFMIGGGGFGMNMAGLISDPQLIAWTQRLSPYLLAAGFIWYLVNRVRIFVNRRVN